MYLEDKSIYGSLPRSVRSAMANILWLGDLPYGCWRFYNNGLAQHDKPVIPICKLRARIWNKMAQDNGQPGNGSLIGYRNSLISGVRVPYLLIHANRVGIYAKLVNLAGAELCEVKLRFAKIRLMAENLANVSSIVDELNKLGILLAVVVNRDYLELFRRGCIHSRPALMPIWHSSLSDAYGAFLVLKKIRRIAKIFCLEHKGIFPLELKPELYRELEICN